MKNQKGITLIALIITIIVMLILVGVSVSISLNGGLFNTAKESVDKTKTASEEEAGLKYEYEIAKATEEYTGTYKEYLLQKEYEEVKSTGSFTGTYKEYVASKYGLGTAINTENYGKKVVGYTSKGEGLDTLVWRLFYQDDKNTYLISETLDAKLPVTGLSLNGDKVSKYKNGADVSVYGQALMPKAIDLFTESNTNRSIIATAYLCDPDVWDEFTDAEGKASYAIGSPTLELFAESYNASDLGHTIELTTNNFNGYTTNVNQNQFSASERNGIYYKWASVDWWLASPDLYQPSRLCTVEGNRRWCAAADCSKAKGARPIVSIPTSYFRISYALSD